ncbi:MAG: hypothetical protein HFJ38_03800, partial [Bacilli bacterium]|nr:hypothetical protein [Bacilli bacterium]
TTTITATASNGKSASASIKVEVDNPNITGAYTYNETTCPTGREDTCQPTTCLVSGSCPAGTTIFYKVNDTTTQDFHVLKDNGSTLTLITQNNTVTGTRWSTTDQNNTNADAAKIALANSTDGWNTTTRMITKEEAESVGCTDTDGSCPRWLHGATSHWTSNAVSGTSTSAWVINSGYNRLYSFPVNNNGTNIRAVININK